MDALNESVVMFRVLGVPAPKGSKTAFVSKRTGRAVVVESASATGRQKLASWASEVSREAENNKVLACPFAGPITVEITFLMPKPKAAPKIKMFSDKKPDVDKLIRATLDSMTGVIFNDDGQVACLAVTKQYAQPGEPTGAVIRVFSVPKRPLFVSYL